MSNRLKDLDSYLPKFEEIILFKEYKISPGAEEGDILGFSYDHVELNIYCNGRNLDTPVLGIKGTVFPVFYGER